jgi:hypothetical protein
MTKKVSRLSERAMLVSLTTHEWTGRKKDKKISSDICVQQNAKQDAGAWWTYLVPQSELQPITATRTRAVNAHYEMTLPWFDHGLRILPSDMFMKYREKLTKLIAEHRKAVNTFIKRWPSIMNREAAKERLGKLAEGQQLPTTAEIREKFGIELNIMAMPDSADFRVNVGDDEIENVRQQITETFQNSVGRATAELWTRLADLVNSVEKSMAERDKTFRNSLITNLKEFCELIPSYNVTDDTNLDAVRKDVLEKLANLNPEDLREIPNNRKKAAKDAKAILDKINDYLK